VYKKGTKVCYPFYGVGKIESIVTKVFDGQEQEYYSVSFIEENLKVMVPVNKAKELGLRGVLSKKEVKALLEVLNDRASESSIKDIDRSYFLHMIGSVDISDVTRGVCDLLCKKEIDGLKRNESDLLKRGINILIGLIACDEKTNPTEARKMIMDCWEEGSGKKKKS